MPGAVVVVPCYDEAARLQPERFLEGLADEPRLSLLFVDDGSKDATFEVLTRLAARAPDRIVAMQLEQNSGKAEAVRRGMLAATEAFPDARFVGFWDADLATPLHEVSRFLRTFDERPELRALLGSRVLMLGRRIDRRLSRHLVGRGMATLIALTLGMQVYDSQCGAKLFRADDVLTAALRKPFAAGWVFDVELLARLRDHYTAAGIALDEAIREQPLLAWTDVAGSKVRLTDGITAVRDLATIRRKYPPPAR